ncbi:MAG: hypothetical protein JXA33_07135 [Anaerolineae bacterium]|nr:hypothetical protein [Anaerolineae bacterium]
MQYTDVQTREAVTYTGFVREGHIQLAETVTLPEGSMVYVLVPVTVDVNAARRKATRWLLEHVGNMLRADQPHFVRTQTHAFWRFGVFVIALAHDPIGPVGYVDVSATNGDILTDEQTAEEIARHGECLECIKHRGYSSDNILKQVLP